MKTPVAFAVALVLAGCNAVLPRNTFTVTGDSMTCSRGEGQFDVDDVAAKALTRVGEGDLAEPNDFVEMRVSANIADVIGNEKKPKFASALTADDLALLMDACRDLLKILPPWPQVGEYADSQVRVFQSLVNSGMAPGEAAQRSGLLLQE
ncbi:MAG: hypothetical protein F4X97_06525 [Boseongicola sp. SB0662_bin_57]|nr:hypothetical protein [Boseongicola sp. SB0662_bin_57]